MSAATTQVVVRELDPVLESGSWGREFASIVLSRPRGGEILYRGQVLKPRADTGLSLQLVCRTSALRRTHLRLPICVDVETVVRVSVGGALVYKATLRPVEAGRPTLRILARDITRWTERAETTRVQLHFSSAARSEALAILAHEVHPECRAVVRQPPGRRYALTSTLFFALAWTALLCVAIVALAHLDQGLLRAYAVVATCVLWVGTLLGLPDLAKLPMRAGMRRLFAATAPLPGALGRRREIVVAVLALACLASCFALAEVEHGIRVRRQYTALIQAALQPRSAREVVRAEALEALALVPWRTEAPILLERAAFNARIAADDPQRFRDVALAVAHSTIDTAIRRRFTEGRPSFLVGDTSSVQNPVVWYASFIIEGEDDNPNERDKQADDLLTNAGSVLESAGEHDTEAALLRNARHVANSNADLTLSDEEIDRRAAVLEQQIKSSPGLIGTHTYLFACDVVAMAYLSKGDEAGAQAWLADELKVRAARGNTTRWLRPPDKFMAYQLFVLFGFLKDKDSKIREDSKGIERARLLAQRPDLDFSPEIDSLARGFGGQFTTTAGWEKGTIYELFDQDGRLETYLEESLARGWKY